MANKTAATFVPILPSPAMQSQCALSIEPLFLHISHGDNMDIVFDSVCGNALP